MAVTRSPRLKTSLLTAAVLITLSALLATLSVKLRVVPRTQSLVPSRTTCAETVHLGDQYGGWVLCVPTLPIPRALVYTVGIGRNIEWDKAMIARFHTRHHGWDPTPTAEDFFRKTQLPNGFVFHRQGLAAADGNVTLKLPVGNGDSYTIMQYHQDAKPGTITTLPMLSLQSMLNKLSHKHLFILKIDIEGAEFDVIDQWLGSSYRIPADQLLVEFHERYFKDGRDRVSNAIQAMDKLGFMLAHRTKLECTFARRASIGGII